MSDRSAVRFKHSDPNEPVEKRRIIDLRVFVRVSAVAYSLVCLGAGNFSSETPFCFFSDQIMSGGRHSRIFIAFAVGGTLPSYAIESPVGGVHSTGV